MRSVVMSAVPNRFLAASSNTLSIYSAGGLHLVMFFSTRRSFLLGSGDLDQDGSRQARGRVQEQEPAILRPV